MKKVGSRLLMGVLAFLIFAGTLAFVYFGIKSSIITLYKAPSKERTYISISAPNYTVIRLTPGREIIIEHTYYDPIGMKMAANSRTFSISGYYGKRIVGSFYFANGDEIWDIRKAPLDTKPVIATLTCTDIKTYNYNDPNPFKIGDKQKDTIYIALAPVKRTTR